MLWYSTPWTATPFNNDPLWLTLFVDHFYLNAWISSALEEVSNYSGGLKCSLRTTKIYWIGALEQIQNCIFLPVNAFDDANVLEWSAHSPRTYTIECVQISYFFLEIVLCASGKQSCLWEAARHEWSCFIENQSCAFWCGRLLLRCLLILMTALLWGGLNGDGSCLTGIVCVCSVPGGLQ